MAKRVIIGGRSGRPPAWLLGQIEAPAGTKDMGGWTAAAYTEEQQARLGVDHFGNKKVQALGPAWTRGEIEPPHGSKDMGGWTAAVYTEEQQARLGVDEFGKKKVQALGPAWTRGDIEAPKGEKDMGGWKAAVYTEEQQARLGVDETGKKVGQGHVQALGPAWTRGEIEAPAGEKDMGGWKAAVYTEEQQARLGVDESGNKKEKPLIGGPGSIGPAWTRGEIERPAGTKNMGTWTAAVYTEEQQARLGVDEFGKKAGHGKVQALGPAWTRGEIEAPAGEKDMGGWKAAVYTEEQQARLGVDESGNKKEKPLIGGGPGSIGPAWTRGEIEAPKGTRDMGGWTSAYYTEEQQARLGVDEFGKPIEEKLEELHIVGGGEGSIGPAWTRGEIEAPAGEKDMGGWTAAVYTEEQQGRLGVDEFGFKK